VAIAKFSFLQKLTKVSPSQRSSHRFANPGAAKYPDFEVRRQFARLLLDAQCLALADNAAPGLAPVRRLCEECADKAGVERCAVPVALAGFNR
jgi:hypothetical protein